MNRRISVAITHFNNTKYITEALIHLINDDRIDEIVICDDNSIDYDMLVKIVDEFSNAKIKLHKNNENIGCYHNKIKTVGYCLNDWAILLDSDNVISTSFLDKLYAIENWDEDKIYAPCFAKTAEHNYSPMLDYREFSNITVTPEFFLQNFNNIKFQCLINTCNYFLPVKNFMKCMNPVQGNYNRQIIDCLDSAILFTDWLCFSKTVFVVDELTYFHRVHAESNYSMSKSKPYIDMINQQMVDKVFTYMNVGVVMRR